MGCDGELLHIHAFLGALKYIPACATRQGGPDIQNDKTYDIQNDPQIYVHLFTNMLFVW